MPHTDTTGKARQSQTGHCGYPFPQSSATTAPGPHTDARLRRYTLVPAAEVRESPYLVRECTATALCIPLGGFARPRGKAGNSTDEEKTICLSRNGKDSSVSVIVSLVRYCCEAI